MKFRATLFAAMALATATAFAADGQGKPEIIHHRPNDQAQAGSGYAPTFGSTSALSQRNKLSYHGGPVFGTPTVYVIWYGNWAQSNGTDNASGQQIVRDFFSAIGGSPYFKINDTYIGSATAISGNVTWSGKEANAAYSYGTVLSDANIQSIVADAINGGSLPSDTNGIYFVMTSSDVNESSGFCTQYCGWHTHGTIGGKSIAYAYIGNAARCITSCAAQSTSPNGNAGVDGMISVSAHELEEATTDTNAGWYARSGSENGDDCAWTFGATYQTSNGSYANMKLGTRDFLIQRNVKMQSNGQYCQLQ
jgi:hypothetical protein